MFLSRDRTSVKLLTHIPEIGNRCRKSAPRNRHRFFVPLNSTQLNSTGNYGRRCEHL